MGERAGHSGQAPQGTLYVCATPIGNLEDITLRVLRVLREASLILAEDTRHTRKLLAHFDIHTPLLSCHEHNEAARIPQVLDALRQGRDVALVSDAGMPGISDPGLRVVQAALDAGLPVTVLPGPSAALTALVLSGLPCDRFAFEGFLPRRAADRQRRLAALAGEERTLIFFEAPHRLAATLADAAAVLGGQRPAAVARELTKQHEEVWRGSLAELARRAAAQPVRGEIVLLIGARPPLAERPWQTEPAGQLDVAGGMLSAAEGSPPAAHPVAAAEELLRQLLARGVAKKEAIAQVARQLGLPKREVYRIGMALSATFAPLAAPDGAGEPGGHEPPPG